MDTYSAVRACAIVLFAGAVLHAADITAGNGIVVDWRTVKSGEELATQADPFDTAWLFVALVGPEAALAALDGEVAPAPQLVPIPTRIDAYAVQPCGGRLRSFDATAREFRVMVEAHEDDAAQAAFVARLAAFCDGLPAGTRE